MDKQSMDRPKSIMEFKYCPISRPLMTVTKWILVLGFFLVGSIMASLLVGCGGPSVLPLLTVNSQIDFEKDNYSTIPVYGVDGLTDLEFDVLGKMSLHGDFKSPEQLKGEMRSWAAGLGADAVVGFYTEKNSEFSECVGISSRDEKHPSYGAGLAVKLLGMETPDAPTRENFICAIPPVKLELVNADAKHRCYYDRVTRDMTETWMAFYGYYGFCIGEFDEVIGVDEIDQMDADSLNTLFGANTEYVLLLTLSYVGFSGDLRRSQDGIFVLRGRLYSLSSGSLVANVVLPHPSETREFGKPGSGWYGKTTIKEKQYDGVLGVKLVIATSDLVSELPSLRSKIIEKDEYKIK